MDTVTSKDARPRLWVLNLDAELELMRPTGYHPTKTSLAACARFSTPARALLGPHDRELVRGEKTKGAARNDLDATRGYVGEAWCPTPSVVSLLERAGAPIEHTTPLSCLQTVNHRSFHAALGQTLPDATFERDLPSVAAKLEQPSPHGWLVKRGFGFASRGVRRIPTPLTQDDARWLTHALVYGGVQVEPWVPIIAEFSLHGYISRDNTQYGCPCRLADGAESVYVHALVGDEDPVALSTSEYEALRHEASRTACELKAAGYVGPFGIDAFAYSWQGKRVFNPRSEVNARYTLAYAVGMRPGPAKIARASG